MFLRKLTQSRSIFTCRTSLLAHNTRVMSSSSSDQSKFALPARFHGGSESVWWEFYFEQSSDLETIKMSWFNVLHSTLRLTSCLTRLQGGICCARTQAQAAQLGTRWVSAEITWKLWWWHNFAHFRLPRLSAAWLRDQVTVWCGEWQSSVESSE